MSFSTPLADSPIDAVRKLNATLEDRIKRLEEALSSGASPRPAKADLPRGPAPRLRTVVADALHHVGPYKAVASEIGVSQGRLSHKLKDGSLTLAQLEKLGPEYALQIGLDLVRVFDPERKTAQQRARERLPELLRELLELTT